MTTRQADQLEAAINRATQHGIEVVAHGRMKSTNSPIYCTNSKSQPDRWHIVTRLGRHLVCDCRSRVVCAHRAAVFMHLTVQAERRAERNALVEEALLHEAAARLDTAISVSWQREQQEYANMHGASLDITRGW